MLNLRFWQEICRIWNYYKSRKEEKTENHGDGGPGTGFFGDQSTANEALMAELKFEDPQAFQHFLRVDVATYADLLSRTEGRITKQTTAFRCPVSPGVKLAFTLRYLATGSCYRDIRYGFRVAHNTMSGHIVSVCCALLDELEEEFVHLPTVEEDWQQVARGFERKWQRWLSG